MAALSRDESIGIQRFIAELQVAAGTVDRVAGRQSLQAFLELSRAIPAQLGCVGERTVREIVKNGAARLAARCPGARGGDLAGWLQQFDWVPFDRLGAALYEFVAELSSRLPREPVIANQRCRLAVEFIHGNYAKLSLSLSEVAGAVGMSRWHLDRLLRSSTGRCFLAHVHEARLDAACSLSANATLTIKEIAAAVGYSSATVLDRHFKRRFGMTPTDWRRLRAVPSAVRRAS